MNSNAKLAVFSISEIEPLREFSHSAVYGVFLESCGKPNTSGFAAFLWKNGLLMRKRSAYNAKAYLDQQVGPQAAN